MLHIDPKFLIGKTFTALDPNLEYTCIGYAANDTFLVVGAIWDQASNRTTVKTLKFQDVKFKGNVLS